MLRDWEREIALEMHDRGRSPEQIALCVMLWRISTRNGPTPDLRPRTPTEELRMLSFEIDDVGRSVKTFLSINTSGYNPNDFAPDPTRPS
jgi:hypothetical protein